MFQRYGLSEYVERTVVETDGVLNCIFKGNSTAGRPFSISAKLTDINRWANGESIQFCCPYLSADEREILMSGTDAESWERMFGSDD